jgi:hypothetical protein
MGKFMSLHRNPPDQAAVLAVFIGSHFLRNDYQMKKIKELLKK